MLISTDWIKEFVTLPEISPKELSSRFTLATAEVEDVIITGQHLDKIIVAEILEIEKHPEAEKLNLVTFAIGNEQKLKVVCGAQNVKVGLRVPYAPLGTAFPDGLVLTPKKIRGIVSEGMLCSEEELGFKDSSDGLLELPSDAPLGLSMSKYFKMPSDVVLNVDNKSLTHRPDLWGHYGMAREFSAIFKNKLKNPFDENWELKLRKNISNSSSPIKVNVLGDSACIAYAGLSVSNISVGDTPAWMKKRLQTVGLRSINSIVDISNYVMLELGLPLHIFDRDLISGNDVFIESLKTDTHFITLDGQNRLLLAGDTIIRDNVENLVLAGIMGGEKSGVKETTKNIFIEVANWKPSMVRKTSTRLGLRTDSSQRFEKTLDSKLIYRTMLRTLELVLEFCPNAKVEGQIESFGQINKNDENIVIKTSSKKINSVLGIELAQSQIVEIFESLDFKVNQNVNDLNVSIPSYRSTKDVSVEEDLIEEIGRIVGFDNIKAISPLDVISPVKLSDFQKMSRGIRNFMSLNAASFEMMTYPLVGPQLLKKVNWPNINLLNILNSISVDHSIMRPSMIPSLLNTAVINAKNEDKFNVFELGRIYTAEEKNFAVEHFQFANMEYSNFENVFLNVANNCHNLLNSLNINFEFVDSNPKFPNPFLPTNWNGTHPFEVRHIKIMGKLSGVIFSVHPLLMNSLKLKGNLTIALLDLNPFKDLKLKEKTKYLPISKLPSATFDWTVDMPANSKIEEAINVAKKTKIKELVNVQVNDVFIQGEKRFLTLRATLASIDVTISSEQLKSAELLLIEATDRANFLLKK